MSRASIYLFVTIAAACGGGQAAPVAPPAAPDPVIEDPEGTFRALEARLTGAERVEMKARLTATGAVAAEMVGHLNIHQRQLVHMDFKGDFDGKHAEALLISDGKGMNGVEAPPAVTEGLLIGLTRMGILHNVAKLAGGGLPDGTDGHVREWVVASGFAQGPARDAGGRRLPSIRFDVAVGGEDVADAILWIDPANGLPVGREQVVRFPEGEMRVIEDYGTFQVSP